MTKIEKAQVVIQALYDRAEPLPMDHWLVKKCSRKSLDVLNEQYGRAVIVLNQKKIS